MKSVNDSWRLPNWVVAEVNVHLLHFTSSSYTMPQSSCKPVKMTRYHLFRIN